MTQAVPATGGAPTSGKFSYSGDPSGSDLDAVRFLTGDTNPLAYFLSDAEIEFLLTEFTPYGTDTPNVVQSAGAASEAIAAKLAREVTYSADGVSVSADTLAGKFYTVAAKIRTLSLRSDVIAGPDFPGWGPGDWMMAAAYDDSLRPLVFSVGMHDNYRAGQQDFGGMWIPPARDYDIRGWGGVASYAAKVASTARVALMAAGAIEIQQSSEAPPQISGELLS